MRAALATLALALALAGCGGKTPPPTGADADEQLASTRRNAALAFSQRRFDQSSQLYLQALELAQARDDGKAIGDLGYDLAVSELRRGNDAESLAAARAARDELQRRGLPLFAELLLVEAAALYRLGQLPAAAAVAEAIADSPGPAGRRAVFLLGMVAADRGDQAALAARLAALGEADGPEWRADRRELEGRAAALRGDGAGAQAAFLAAADLRQETLDYPSMARALAAAAAVAERQGEAPRAADLYLRAGRSAMLAAGGAGPPERWLDQAERLARASGQTAIVQAVAELRRRRE